MRTDLSAIDVTIQRNRLTGWLSDRRFGTKILVSTAVLTLVAIGIGIVSLTRMSELDSNVKELKVAHLESMAELVVVRQGVGEMYRGLSLYAWQAADPSFGPRGRQAVKDGDAMVLGAAESYRKLAAGSPARVEQITTLTTTFTRYAQLRNLLVFQEQPPAGASLPTGAAEQSKLWNDSEVAMNSTLAALQQLEMDEATAKTTAARDSYHQARLILIVCLVVGLLLALAVSVRVNRLMAAQLRTVSDALDSMAGGDLTRRAEVRARDELGAMAVAVNRAADGIRTTVHTLSSGAQTLGQSAGQLTQITARIAGSARDTADQANLVSGDAGTVSNNVQTVAAGSEEMSASIREIAQNANDVSAVATEAVAVADSANQTVAKLGESSTEIGNVVKVITSIAEQTNLLALNATIEAARAGESGKGFAVVASEVKDLAQETARATEDISRRVETIQSDTTNAVQAIQKISQIIARINDYQLTIASAVEEQTATTNEMSRNISDAASGAGNIARVIGGVADAAQTTTTILGDADHTVTELSRLAGELQEAVSRFRT
jgi:methyl-accepting chemotaxis protein